MSAASETDWSNLAPELTEPHVSNRVLQGFLSYIARTYGEDTAAAVVESAGLPGEYIREPGGWVSMAYTRNFISAVMEHVFGRDDWPTAYDAEEWQLWRRAGAASLQPDQIGPTWPMFRAFGSPGFLFGQIPAAASHANRVGHFELLRKRRGFVEISVHPAPGAPPDEAPFCWNRIGFMETVPTIWGLPRAVVTHTRCMHDPLVPSDACVYRVTFRERRFFAPVMLLARIASATGLGVLISWLVLSGDALLMGAVAGGLVGVALEGWIRYRGAAAHAKENDRLLDRVYAETDRRYRELWEEREALRRSLLANRKISGYLADALVEEILSNPELELELGGQLVHAAILFVDIVDFTPRCESDPPEQVVADLNRFFAYIDPVVKRSGGIIDKRLGDGLMAVFVAHDGDGASAPERRAVACAVDMLRAVERCNAELEAVGSASMQVRIGLAAGPLIQGNLGSDVRLEYTVVGDTVNLAARLQSLATPDHALMTDNLTPYLPDGALLIGHRTVRVKGKEMPVDVAEVAPAPSQGEGAASAASAARRGDRDDGEES